MSQEGLVRAVRRGVPGGPVLVLLHGLGSNEQDLISFAPQMPPDMTVVALRAPTPYAFGGFAWFDIQWLPQGRIVDQDQALLNRDRLIREIERISQEFAAPGQGVFLGGFSQGAMMSLGVMLGRPDLLRGVLLLSGRSLPRFFDSVHPDASQVPVLIQHGLHDEVLRIEEGRAMRDELLAMGVAVDFREYRIGHEVSAESLSDLLAWLASHVRVASS